VQIILSAIISCSIVSILFYDEFYSKAISAVLSGVLTGINLYLKNSNLSEHTKEHQKVAHELWKVREEYVSLLTDLDELDKSVMVKKRDELQNRTYEIYKNAPKTDSKSYKEARKVLKNEEEQTFSKKELDLMLPPALRKNKTNLR
ncbi:SLATT domain-containing protein, partial [Gilliamella sp. Fer4-1]|uniref:SLATT domain-containing protein n=2 Tax=Gilliamella TaxID=1193503 RepID=UPI00080EC244